MSATHVRVFFIKKNHTHTKNHDTTKPAITRPSYCLRFNIKTYKCNTSTSNRKHTETVHKLCVNHPHPNPKMDELYNIVVVLCIRCSMSL